MPYKRYAAPDIEQVLEEIQPVELDADNATLYRLKKWFQSLAPYLLGCLRSISLRLEMNTVKEPSVLSQSVHQRIGHYVGYKPGLAGENCPSRCKHKFMGTYPFRLFVRKHLS